MAWRRKSSSETALEKVFQYIDQHQDAFIERLGTLLRQPSVAAQNLGMEPCAKLVKEMLDGVGFKTQMLPTEGFPVVYGELAGAGDRVLMLYDHYDVQPPEPLELWQSDPWDPQIRDGKLFARGSSDNKGDLTARLCAIEAYQKTLGELPVNIKFVIEGEEEIGSPHLAGFTERHKNLLKADGCIWEFGHKDLREIPQIYLGLKGICYVELSVKGAGADQHSSWGTIVPNAAWRLVWALNTLKDEDEKIRIKGFTQSVRKPGKTELRAVQRLNFDETGWREKFGVQKYLLGLRGHKLKQKHYFEPTCTICGVWSGYTGPGPKTVLPAEARAKIDFRLVPDQDPDEVVKLLKQHLKKHGFDDIEVIGMHGTYPARTPLDDPLVEIVRRTAVETYKIEPVVHPTSAASGPMYVLCQKLGIPAVSTGVGYAHSNTHAPNENIRIGDFIQGIKHIVRIVHEFGSD